MRTTVSLGALTIAMAGAGAILARAADDPPRGSFHVAPISARDTDRQAVVRGNAAFALDVYGSLRGQPGNLVFSPLSLSTALAMTMEGAAGATRKEIASVLRMDLRPRRTGRALQSVLADLEPASADVRIEVANGLWVAEQIPFRPEFVATLAKRFGAGAAELDFQGDPGGAREEINSWGADATHGEIPEVLPPGYPSPETAFVLANAIWFQGKWAQPFDERQTDVFSLPDGTRVPCPLMRRPGPLGLAAGPGYQAVEIPYDGDDFVMLVVVPDDVDGLPAVEAALTSERLSELTRELQQTYVELWFPPFSFDRHLDLKGTLQTLGVTQAFDKRRADFSRAVLHDVAWIDGVLQAASVRVDEEGTVAAAVTVVIGMGETQSLGSAPPFVIRVDHPFLFAIRHRPTGTILFLGRVEDPTK